MIGGALYYHGVAEELFGRWIRCLDGGYDRSTDEVWRGCAIAYDLLGRWELGPAPDWMTVYWPPGAMLLKHYLFNLLQQAIATGSRQPATPLYIAMARNGEYRASHPVYIYIYELKPLGVSATLRRCLS